MLQARASASSQGHDGQVRTVTGVRCPACGLLKRYGAEMVAHFRDEHGLPDGRFRRRRQHYLGGREISAHAPRIAGLRRFPYSLCLDGHLPRVPDVVPLASSKVKDMRSSQLDCPPMTDEVAEPICETPRMRHIQQVPDKDRSNFTGAVYPALVWLHRFRVLASAGSNCFLSCCFDASP